jgi:hypothetical protein
MIIINDKKYEYNLIRVNKESFESNKYSKKEKLELQHEINLLIEEKEKEDIKYIEEILKERLVIWFKFFFARIILQRYCNIPSGLLVVKLEDYSMRMITEVYNDKKLINISKNQNDGSSKSFNKDGLVNLFLYTFNAYLLGRKTRVLSDLDFNINTISDSASSYDEDVIKMVKDMENEIREYNKSQEK